MGIRTLGEKEAVETVMRKAGLSGDLVRHALGMAYLYGSAAGYREGSAAGLRSLDRALGRMEAVGRKGMAAIRKAAVSK